MIATNQKAVRARGPGRVVLGSKPQLATTKKLVRWAMRATGPKTRALGHARNWPKNSCAGPCAQLAQKLVRWAMRATGPKTRALGHARNWPKNSCAGLRA